jgi:predicted RNA-binding Zn-ribbon protein involved in translation (DUF1610 family)
MFCNCDAPVIKELVDENFVDFKCSKCGKSWRIYVTESLGVGNDET